MRLQQLRAQGWKDMFYSRQLTKVYQITRTQTSPRKASNSDKMSCREKTANLKPLQKLPRHCTTCMKMANIAYHIFHIHFIFILQFMLSVASHSPSGTIATLQCERSVLLISFKSNVVQLHSVYVSRHLGSEF